MVTKIQKWGNSLGVRLSKAAAEEAGVSAGAAVDVRVRGGEIVVRPLRPARYRLAELLADIRPDNVHAEGFVDSPRGKEAL